MATSEDLQAFSNEFDILTAKRHAMGEEKYGPGTFLGVDTMQEAMDEVADLANYARYTYIKLRVLQEKVKAQEPEFRKSLD